MMDIFVSAVYITYQTSFSIKYIRILSRRPSKCDIYKYFYDTNHKILLFAKTHYLDNILVSLVSWIIYTIKLQSLFCINHVINIVPPLTFG